jgi:hypothetical protein
MERKERRAGEDRRSDHDRRTLDNPNFTGTENRREGNRRFGIDRRKS